MYVVVEWQYLIEGDSKILDLNVTDVSLQIQNRD